MTERLDPYELIADDEWDAVELLSGLPGEARSTPDAAGRRRSDREQRSGPADGDAPSEEAHEDIEAA